MHQNGRLDLRLIIPVAVALLVLAGPAIADDVGPMQELKPEISASAMTPPEKPEASEGWLHQLHIKKGHGFEYSKSFTTSSKKKLIFSIQGPLVKKKTPGLGFEIRF
jgi:hypothetical protein